MGVAATEGNSSHRRYLVVVIILNSAPSLQQSYVHEISQLNSRLIDSEQHVSEVMQRKDTELAEKREQVLQAKRAVEKVQGELEEQKRLVRQLQEELAKALVRQWECVHCM